jgi:hypothetical protein
MRSYDMSMNKGEEWIQLAQVPQVMAPEGSIITPITDEPGLVIETDPNVVAGSNVKPEWKPTAERSRGHRAEAPDLPGRAFPHLLRHRSPRLRRIRQTGAGDLRTESGRLAGLHHRPRRRPRIWSPETT